MAEEEGERIVDNKNKIDAARRESSDFSLSTLPPNRRSRPSPVARSFYSVLFSDAPRRLLIRQRIEEEACCHADASTETVKLPALFLSFRRVLAAP